MQKRNISPNCTHSSIHKHHIQHIFFKANDETIKFVNWGGGGVEVASGCCRAIFSKKNNLHIGELEASRSTAPITLSPLFVTSCNKLLHITNKLLL